MSVARVCVGRVNFAGTTFGMISIIGQLTMFGKVCVCSQASIR